MRSRNIKERRLAEEAKLLTQRKLSQNKFFVKYYGKDRYGRWLVRIHFHQDKSTLKGELEKNGLLTGKYKRARKGSDICE